MYPVQPYTLSPPRVSPLFCCPAAIRYDLIMFDVDCKDPSLGMSCPPVPFVEPSFLEDVRHCLAEEQGRAGVCRLLPVIVRVMMFGLRLVVVLLVGLLYCGRDNQIWNRPLSFKYLPSFLLGKVKNYLKS